MLFKSDRIVVPRPLRAEVLDEIHGAHMGESKSPSFARDYVSNQRQSQFMCRV